MNTTEDVTIAVPLNSSPARSLYGVPCFFAGQGPPADSPVDSTSALDRAIRTALTLRVEDLFLSLIEFHHLRGTGRSAQIPVEDDGTIRVCATL